ncbi:hypothetical protein F7725_011842 [Dissostichus mawsoni]|uniref:DUF4371 domain-containing protein n=1 Tax=Dissostichus mawsoni TaxID=36200 RepID=A0A7J5ZBY8_DISMA|nr:hypothetical protein F7725_011842 [Dissostichus mawsoni]
MSLDANGSFSHYTVYGVGDKGSFVEGNVSHPSIQSILPRAYRTSLWGQCYDLGVLQLVMSRFSNIMFPENEDHVPLSRRAELEKEDSVHYSQASTILWKSFKATQVHGDIREQLHAANVSEIQDRWEYLKRVAAVTAFLGKQGIAFRGHNEAGESDNKGHFMECMKLLENFDPFLQTYKPPSCVTYLSPSSQNDMIESTADVTMARIISEIKEAKMYSVMVDEARDNHTEQLALCVQNGVCEAVPHASSFPYEPPSLRAGGEAERSPQHANQQVADGNVNQEQVDGRPQHLVAAEENEHQQVVEQSESADEAQAHSHHQVPCRTQGGPVGASPLVPVPDRGTQRAVCSRAAAQAHVGHDHRERSRSPRCFVCVHIMPALKVPNSRIKCHQVPPSCIQITHKDAMYSRYLCLQVS